MRRRLGALVLGLIVSLAGIGAVAFRPGMEFEHGVGLHWLFAMRGPLEAPKDVVIVALDEQSAQRLGIPSRPRDWPRNLHAQLVRFLAQAGARIVVFDMTFETPSAQASHDEELAAAILQAGNVVIASSMQREMIALAGASGKPVGSVLIEKPTPPIESIERAVRGHAPFLLPKDPRVDVYWTFANGAIDAPTLPVLAVHLFAAQAFDDFWTLFRSVQPAAPSVNTRVPRQEAAESAIDNLRSAREALRQDAVTTQRMLARLRAGSEEATPRRHLVETLLNLYSADDVTYLNYYGPPRSIETVPYFQVLEAARGPPSAAAGPVEAVRFRDKAVFVGYSAEFEAGQDRLRDSYRTVFSRSSGHDISGVEIAATAFANVVQHQSLRPASAAWQFIAVGAWGLLLGIVCRALRPARAVGVVSALAVLLLWIVYRQFADAGIWWPSAIPVGVQMPLALFAGFWLSNRDVQQQRQAVERAFAQFLPGTVVEQLARNVGQITAHNRVVFGVCLATDAEQYTRLAEQTAPAELGDFMNTYYAKLFAPVERTGGVVIDVVGDSMVAIWAGAASDAELRAKACRAALEIVATERQADVVAPGLHTRLGLHSGDMLIGSVGAAHHYEYRAVGDIVNTASRIQGLNKTLGTALLASAATVEGLDGFATRPLGSFLLAGKSSAVAIVELLGAVTEVNAAVAQRCTVFAGALEAFRARRWSEAAEGFARVQTLAGAASDGPARFYLERCRQLLTQVPGADWTPTVRVDVK
jgi:adenylate cyclase